MHKGNLKMISQPHWKVSVLDFVARMLGLLAHVEGIPIGDSKDHLRRIRSVTQQKTVKGDFFR